MVLEWGSLGLTITNDLCKSSFCTRMSKRAGGPWSGQMCTSVVTVTAPFSSSSLEGMAGHRHLDTRLRAHSLPPQGTGVSRAVSLQPEGSLEMTIQCMWPLQCVWGCISVSGDIFVSPCFTPSSLKTVYPFFVHLFASWICGFSGWQRHIE